MHRVATKRAIGCIESHRKEMYIVARKMVEIRDKVQKDSSDKASEVRDFADVIGTPSQKMVNNLNTSNRASEVRQPVVNSVFRPSHCKEAPSFEIGRKSLVAHQGDRAECDFFSDDDKPKSGAKVTRKFETLAS